MALRTFYQVILISYTVGSPFLFFWFHKNVMRETWNDDMADRVTLTLYVMSNIAAQYLAYLLQTGWCP